MDRSLFLPTWVWIPGGSLSEHFWSPLHQALVRSSPSIAALNHVFLRFSSGTPFWQQVVQQMPSGPVVLLGWSMGGFIALEVALRRKKSVVGMVLGSSGASFPMPEGQKDFLLQHMKKDLPGFLRNFYENLFSPYEKEQGMDIQFQQKLFRPDSLPSYELLVEGLDYLQKISISEEQLQSLLMPVCVHVGQKDPILPPSVTEHLAQVLPQVECCSWDQAGHVVAWTSPESVAQSTRLWWKKARDQGFV